MGVPWHTEFVSWGFPDARSSRAAGSAVALSTPLSGHERFGGTWLHRHPNRIDPEKRGSMFLRNIGIHIQDYTVAQPKYHNLNQLTYSGCQDFFIRKLTTQLHIFVFLPVLNRFMAWITVRSLHIFIKKRA